MSIFLKKPPRPKKTSKNNEQTEDRIKRPREKATTNNSSSKLTSANPVFEKWIMEWRDDAIAKELQSKHTYTKVFY
jgi:hypothetical protein